MKKLSYLILIIAVFCNTITLRAQEMDNLTPLMSATYSDDNFDEVKRMVLEGINILEQDEFGNDAIDWADYFGSYTISKYLHSVLMVKMFYEEIKPSQFGEIDQNIDRKSVKCRHSNYTFYRKKLNNGVFFGVTCIPTSGENIRYVYKNERELILYTIKKFFGVELEITIKEHLDEESSFVHFGGYNGDITCEVFYTIPTNEWIKYKKDNDYNFKCGLMFIVYDFKFHDQWEKEGMNYI